MDKIVSKPIPHFKKGDAFVGMAPHPLVFMEINEVKGSTALSSVASLILHGNRNGWEYWCTEDGKQLGQIEGLKK